MNASDRGPEMYEVRMDAFASRWFSSYGEARTALDAEGGYLPPYRDQLFVPVAGAIEEPRLDPPAAPGAWQPLRPRREVAS